MSIKPRPSTGRKRITRWSEAALKGCDWFVDTQVTDNPPDNDANRGRYIYNLHVPSGKRVQGIGWTQARGVMCLLAAYLRTGRRKYLDSAERAVAYMKSLQDTRCWADAVYGAFREETPLSSYCYPRDGMEVADALLQWHEVTGDADALLRAVLFLDWIERCATVVYPGFGWWIRAQVGFEKMAGKEKLRGPAACEMGCGTIFAHAYAATGKRKYKSLAIRVADQTLKNYLRDTKGPLTEPPGRRMSHHADSRGRLYNDDGGGVALLNAYKLSGRSRYLDAALQTADFYCQSSERIPLYCGIGSIANFLLETYFVTGQEAYRRKAAVLLRELVALQVSRAGPARGGFRGEDEGGANYVPRAKDADFVTARVTAYAILSLFKFEDIVRPAGYAASFWDSRR